MSVFVGLIITNCIILGRAEAFASKNPPVPSIADGLGIGVGFTIALGFLAAIREAFGAGTISIPFSDTVIQLFGASYEPFTFMVEAPGAFVCLGLVLALMNLAGE